MTVELNITDIWEINLTNLARRIISFSPLGFFLESILAR